MESSEKLSFMFIQLFPTLPYALIHRVLCLLPVKSLFRFRCVCKQWRTLPFSLLFGEIPATSSPGQHHFWLFAFRLLARKVNEYQSSTYKSTLYTYSLAYDREMMGSCGCVLQPPLEDADCDRAFQGSYAALAPSTQMKALLESGVVDIVASWRGLLLLTLRLSKVHDHEENNLKLFVYNPISKDIRALPTTRWAPQKLFMVACRDDDRICGYKVYSLGRGYRPGSTNLLYSVEVFDSTQAGHGWQFMSHVRANLSGSGDLHPGTETPLMGYVNAKAIANELGFLYWMPSLDHKAANGRHTELNSCHMSTGLFYRVPGLSFKSTFAHMWPSSSGVMSICGVAQGDDLSSTCGVEVWELLQGEEGPLEDDLFYGVKDLPQGTRWHPCSRMPHDLWDHLTSKGTRRVACTVAIPLVFVVVENEKEHMVVYDTDDKTWKLTVCWPFLQNLFQDRHSAYYQVYPWIITVTPNVSALV